MLRFSYARLLLTVALLVPTLAHAWWQADWQFRKPLTVQPPAEEAGLVASDLPVLLRLHAGNFGFFADTKADGADLRLMAGDDTTPLKYHIERYDPVTGMGLLWVRVPQLAAGAPASAYLYYGNAAAPAGDDAAGTYDAEQALVFHFGEAQGAPRDSTANANHAAESGAQAQAASLIGGGLHFTGSETLRVPGSASLAIDPAKGLTISLWIRPDAVASGAVLELGSAEQPLLLGLADGVPVARIGAVEARAAAPLPAGEWHHLALTVDAGTATLYVDGAPAGSAAVELKPIAGDLVLGAGPLAQAAGLAGVAADIDEFGLARVARSAGYLRLLALTQGTAASLIAYGEDESGEAAGGHGSYIGVVLQNVTLDGWIIIGLLAVMSGISWVVMFGKGRFLGLARKRNTAFYDAFRKLGNSDFGDGDLTALARQAQFVGAPLQRICAAATDELNDRLLHRSVGAQASALSPQALDALRARVDAAAVREQQRLNSGMVLLTIAISGGPFLGLLGTVVGVMITFAAIAASGEVNVNSIAPGIAAALVATVAGLVVAIPALFGYNYLGTLIRDTTTDLRVFVDELLADIAERHSA
jgi:biopolymer transport protein ExbB